MDNKKILDFIKKYDAKFYAVRDMAKSNSKLFNLKVEKKNVVEYVKEQRNFLINVSSYNYTENQLCTGEIQINKDMKVSLTISNNKEFSARDAVRCPDFNFVCDIYDRRLKNIDGLQQVMDYIFQYNLFDVIVEFSSFDIPVGLNCENVIIYELRTDY
ncbi:MAG: hypothetical protein E7375_02700 [Clostridiales bacterium]|nr:hypothetical protein [Clostridiales bacterium]